MKTMIRRAALALLTVSLLFPLTQCSKDKEATPEVKLTTKILNISEGDNVTEGADLVVDVKSTSTNKMVKMGAICGTLSNEISSFTNPKMAEKTLNLGNTLAPGSYELKAYTVDESGDSDTVSVNITVTLAGAYNESLVFRVPFNGSNDDVVGNLTATVVGTPSFAVDKNGETNKAYQGATDSYLTYDISSVTWKTGDMTISVWHKTPNPSSGRASMVTLWGDESQTDNKYRGVTLMRRDKRFSSNIGTTGGDTWCGGTDGNGGTIGFVGNQWYNITLTIKDGTTVALYVDGVLDNTKDITEVAFEEVNNLTVGSGLPHYTRYSYGTVEQELDEVRIYNRALTQSEIDAMINE